MADDAIEHIENFTMKLSEKTLTHQNFREDINKVQTYSESMEMQMDSEYKQYRKWKTDFKGHIDDTKIARFMREDKVVPLDIFNELKEAFRYLESVMTLKYLQNNLEHTALVKTIEALGAIKAHDIEKEVLANYRQISAENVDLIKDIVNHKLKLIDEQSDRFRENMDLRFQHLQTQFQGNIVEQMRGLLNEVNTNKREYNEPQRKEVPMPITTPKFETLDLPEQKDIRHELKLKETPQPIIQPQENVPILQPAPSTYQPTPPPQEPSAPLPPVPPLYVADQTNKTQTPQPTDGINLTNTPPQESIGFACKKCGKKFNEENSLNAHVKLFHGGV